MLNRLSSRSLASLYDESRERMPPKERQEWLDNRLARQVLHAYRSSPAVKEILDGARVSPSEIRGVKDLQKIPVTSKDALVRLQREKPPFGGFLTKSATDIRRVYISPGPIYDVYGPEQVRVDKELHQSGISEAGGHCARVHSLPHGASRIAAD